VELDEFGVLVREAGAHGHGVPVARARVRARAGEVRPPVSAGGEDRVLGAYAVDRPVLHVQGHGAHARPVVGHEQVHREILDEVGGVEREAAAVQGVEHGVAGPVGGARAPVRLPPLAIFEALPPEGPLVYLPLLGPAEGQAEFLQLEDRLRRLPAHVVYRVLVPEPVGSLHGVVHVPPPIVGAHVPERGVDPPLRGDRVGSGREQLRDARGLEPRLGQTHRRA